MTVEVTKTVKAPSPVWRFFATVGTLVAGFAAQAAYRMQEPLIEGDQALNQLSGDATEQAVSRFFVNNDVGTLILAVAGIIVLCIWVQFAFAMASYRDAAKKAEENAA